MSQNPREYSIYDEPEGTSFTEGWCTDLEKSAIQHSYDRVRHLNGLCIEIGCFEGRSSVFTTNLIFPERLICIDPWVPVPYSDYEVMAYGERPIRETFDHNMKVGTNGNFVVAAEPYEHFFERFAKEPQPVGIKYLYLDGPHAYADVMLGLETVAPHMVEGGVLLGDDYDSDEVFRAANDFFGVWSCHHPKSDRTFEWVF